MCGSGRDVRWWHKRVYPGTTPSTTTGNAKFGPSTPAEAGRAALGERGPGLGVVGRREGAPLRPPGRLHALGSGALECLVQGLLGQAERQGRAGGEPAGQLGRL